MSIVLGMLAGYVLGFLSSIMYSGDAHRRGYRQGLRDAVKYREEDFDYLEEEGRDCQW